MIIQYCILALILVAVLVWSIRKLYRLFIPPAQGQGGCSGGCSGCGLSAPSCSKDMTSICKE